MDVNYKNIVNILNELWIDYEEIIHPESHSCDESKKFREEQWFNWLWSKNIIFHSKWQFYLVVTHWDKQIKARNFKHEFWSKDIRFASQEEITSIWLWIIGSISPFGFINSQIPVFVDREIFDNEYFIFNPFDPTKSIKLESEKLKEIYSHIWNEVKYFVHKGDEFKIID